MFREVDAGRIRLYSAKNEYLILQLFDNQGYFPYHYTAVQVLEE